MRAGRRQACNTGPTQFPDCSWRPPRFPNPRRRPLRRPRCLSAFSPKVSASILRMASRSYLGRAFSPWRSKASQEMSSKKDLALSYPGRTFSSAGASGFSNLELAVSMSKASPYFSFRSVSTSGASSPTRNPPLRSRRRFSRGRSPPRPLSDLPLPSDLPLYESLPPFLPLSPLPSCLSRPESPLPPPFLPPYPLDPLPPLWSWYPR
mmetsp:Transcript_93836/g.251101  ORF Transcript_93836/g.251101 Transcript_93836/m.251101 type:complete len:207 (+) Transcript_93836:97-717(+)